MVKKGNQQTKKTMRMMTSVLAAFMLSLRDSFLTQLISLIQHPTRCEWIVKCITCNLFHGYVYHCHMYHCNVYHFNVYHFNVYTILMCTIVYQYNVYHYNADHYNVYTILMCTIVMCTIIMYYGNVWTCQCEGRRCSSWWRQAVRPS